MKDFYSLQWGTGLDPEVHAHRLKVLLEKGLPTLDAVDVERIVSNQFLSSFPRAYADKFRLLFAGKTPSLAEAVATARDVVRIPSDGAQACAAEVDDPPCSEEYNQLNSRLEKLELQIAAVNTRVPRRPVPTSWATRRNSRGEEGDAGGERFERAEDGERRGQRTGRVRCFNCSGFGHIARHCASPPQQGRRGNGQAGGHKPTPNLRQ